MFSRAVFFTALYAASCGAQSQQSSPDPSAASKAAAQAASRSLQSPNARSNLAAQPVTPITFSEYPSGTVIEKQYQNRGVLFDAHRTFITSDGSNPTSPVLSGSPRFVGPIEGKFVDEKTGSPIVVESFSFDGGYFDNFGSTRVQWFDPKGKVLGQRLNSRFGIEKFTVSGGNIASWRIETIADEPSGFAVDNVSLTPVGASILFRENGQEMKEGTWGMAKDEIPGWDHTAFQFGNKVFESHPGYPAGTYRSADGTETAAIGSINGVQSQHTKATFLHDSRTSATPTVAREEIPISNELAVGMSEAINSVVGRTFQFIDYSMDGLSKTLSPAAQKGGNGTFTCVGLVEWAAEKAGHQAGEGFILNKFESMSIIDPRDTNKTLLIPLLSPQLLNYAMKGQMLMSDAKQWVQGFFDPVMFVVRDPLGRRIGETTALGKLTEIPNSFFSGPGGVQQFLVPNAVPGEYTVTLVGLDGQVLSAVGSNTASKGYYG